MKRTLAEWIAFYETKSMDKLSDSDWKSFDFLFDEEQGFSCFIIKNNTLYIHKTCGNGQYWRNLAEEKANNMGIKILQTSCTRNIKPYLRAFKFRIISEQNKSGKHYIFCQDELGRKVIAISNGVRFDGVPAYSITQYLNASSI